MKIVKIADLKNRLINYLRRGNTEWLDRLERRGVLRRGTGKLSREWLARKPRVGADVVATLLRERREGR
jgi:hypothetical protein